MSEIPPRPEEIATYKHAEAFCLMWYHCLCGHAERIWNSRDGVTPFGIRCPSCGNGSLTHRMWNSDERAIDHKPYQGQRVFRDGTVEEAIEIYRRRIASFPPEAFTPGELEQALDAGIAAARNGTDEFRPGWPILVTVRDNRTIP